MAEQDGSASNARKALTRAQWSIRCTLNQIDELTATLHVCFRRLSKLELEERSALAQLEALAPIDLLRIGAFSDCSGRRSASPSWWLALPAGWRLCTGDVLEDVRARRVFRFASGDELVAFVRRLHAPLKLPAPKPLRVRPRARSRRRTAGGRHG